MKADRQTLPDEMMTCEACMKEIPLSEAKSDEASDYVVYFCGLDCYQTWSSQKSDEESLTT